jgi:hypothetical protein
LWDAEIFECKLYDVILRIRQCFKCYKYGHIAKYCRKTARCEHCAAAAHEQENENVCSNKQPSGTKRCVNCISRHTAWNRACPAYKNASERAKEAYTHRPRQFVVASTTANTSESNKGRMCQTICTIRPKGWSTPNVTTFRLIVHICAATI